MWIEIFKGGRQFDAAGREHDGDALIESAVAKFNAEDPPPLVLGHPRMDSPAYGWVRRVKAAVEDGTKKLLADVEPVEALRDWVRGGFYRNRSAAFYADGRLRHVGFLGGTPPAVKGMAPLPAFADEAGFAEFVDGYQQGIIARIFRRMREYFIEQAGAETADRLLPDYEIEDLGRVPAEVPEPVEQPMYTAKGGDEMKFSEFMAALNIFRRLGGKDEDIDLVAPVAPPAPPARPGDEPKTFSEADVEEARRAAAEEAKAAAAAEFAEREKRRRAEARKTDIQAFCESAVEAGKVAPAWVAAGIGEFMEQLADEAEAALTFAEGAEKQTPYAWFREFLDGLPKLVDFGEVATRDKNVAGGADLLAVARAKMGEDKDLSFAEALKVAQAERPDLFEAWLNAPRG